MIAFFFIVVGASQRLHGEKAIRRSNPSSQIGFYCKRGPNRLYVIKMDVDISKLKGQKTATKPHRFHI